jgi:hypothetical protein
MPQIEKDIVSHYEDLWEQLTEEEKEQWRETGSIND